MSKDRRTIAISVAEELKKQGIVASVTTIQFFLALSKPLRSLIRTQLEQQSANLLVQKAKFLAFTRRGDCLSDKISKLRIISNEVLSPIERVLSQVPIDTAAASSPVISDEMKEIADSLNSILTNIPLKLSPSVVNLIGFDDFDFFDGVDSFSDLKDKIDELEFRSARAVALSQYASTGIYYIENQLEKINIYSKIIEFLGY
jgi:hypothetical protein